MRSRSVSSLVATVAHPPKPNLLHRKILGTSESDDCSGAEPDGIEDDGFDIPSSFGSSPESKLGSASICPSAALRFGELSGSVPESLDAA